MKSSSTIDKAKRLSAQGRDAFAGEGNREKAILYQRQAMQLARQSAKDPEARGIIIACAMSLYPLGETTEAMDALEFVAHYPESEVESIKSSQQAVQVMRDIHDHPEHWRKFSLPTEAEKRRYWTFKQMLSRNPETFRKTVEQYSK
jgi:hypothetical protein